MTVYQQDFIFARFILKNKTLMHFYTREQRPLTHACRAVIAVVMTVTYLFARFYNVMVPVQHIKSVFFIKFRHYAERLAVNLRD